MKILQNETTTTTTAAPNSITTDKEKLLQQQQHQQFVVEKRKAKTLKNKILQNVAQQLQQQQQQQQHSQQLQPSATEITTASTIAMTDELTPSTAPDYNTHSGQLDTSTASSADIKTKDLEKDLTSTKSCSSNNNSSELIIAEAAKILLKNGLNGTNAAAAAAVATATATLLTAAANFQLPHQQQQNSSQLSLTTTSSALSSSSSSSSLKSVASESAAVAANSTTAAAAAHAQLVAIAAAAAAVNATNHKRLTALNSSNSSPASTFTNNNLISSKSCPSNHQLNNGTPNSTPSSTDSISPSSAHFAKPLKTNCLSSSSSSTTKSTPTTTMSSTSAMDMGVIDYTINSHNSLSAANNNANISLSTTSPSSSVINLSTSNINNNHKFVNSTNNNNHSHHLNRSDIGRTPISSHLSTNNHNHSNAVGAGGAGGFGGRLQFFKDGKFILELARSKDGEKGGWVSVPRKVFRTPSAATSSTVTPSATASTSAAVIPSPLTASSPVATIGGNGGSVSYPKNECSNSLSFSDDNSSLQSSPWQRDHCWKPAAPRKNVSIEMTLFYHKPACRKLTAKALLLAQRKRRKPYDRRTLENNKLFWFKKTTEEHQVVVDNTQTEIQAETKVEECNDGDKKTKDMEEKVKGVKQKNSNEDTMKISDATNGGATEECKQYEDDKLEMLKEEHNDAEMTKLSPLKKEDLDTEVLGEDRQNKDEEKMNTSDCDVEAPNKSPPLNGNVSNQDSHNLRVLGTTSTVCNKLQGDEEQRLKKPETIKTRAKLTTIVQKLLDASVSRLAATAHHSFKTSTNSRQQSPSAANTSFASTASSPASCSGGAKNQNSKVSPPSSTAASRLVEYHQQHVSPRKRILRELEKVSLEDNVTAAGGKRSRAKGNNIPSTTPHGGITHSQALTSPMNKLASTGGGGLNVHSSNSGNQSKITAPITTTAPQTKLYSSYSIHSLLGGTSNSVSPSSSSLKKVVDLPATITSNSLPYSSYHSASITHHQSPKSPEGNTPPGGGGKSPSNSASKVKRSPPYSSPLRDVHSRSPTINATTSGNSGSFDYGRRSPRITAEGYNKIKYSGASENTGSPHHYNHATQNYYAQYMASPHYVPSLGSSSALSPSTSSSGGTSTTNNTNSSRSPRHHSSAFRATTPTSSTMAAIGVTSNANQNIPSTQRGDMSPQRSATASPREATPRTVPKKTASIRRQFASPTSINTTTTITNNNSSSPSPSMIIDNRNEDNDRRTPVTHHQQQHSLLQRSSPGSANMQNSPLHPYSYMYASATNNQHPSNATHPASPTSANVSAAAAAAAAAASYIPAVVSSPYYHPYISTLAAMRHPQMWMQHYQSAAAAAANPALLQASRHPTMLSAAAAGAAAARLSPPYHGYQYNGVSNAVAFAAAAAAAGFGSATSASSSHHSNVLSSGNTLAPPGSIFNPMAHGLVAPHPATLTASSGLLPATASAALGSSAHPMTDTINTDLSKASRNNYSSSSSSSSLASSSPLPGTGVSGGVSVSTSGSSGNTMYPISNKDEQSSDVPLNLSKH